MPRELDAASPVPLREPTPEQLAHYSYLLAAEGDFELVLV